MYTHHPELPSCSPLYWREYKVLETPHSAMNSCPREENPREGYQSHLPYGNLHTLCATLFFDQGIFEPVLSASDCSLQPGCQREWLRAGAREPVCLGSNLSPTTLGKFLPSSVPQFPQLKIGSNNSTCFLESW